MGRQGGPLGGDAEPEKEAPSQEWPQPRAAGRGAAGRGAAGRGVALWNLSSLDSVTKPVRVV